MARYNHEVGARYTRAEGVLAAAAAGDQAAAAIIESAGVALGVSLGWLVNVLDPEALVIGGGLGMAEGPFWDTMIASTREHIWSDTSRDLPILHAALGNDAGIIGAARSTVQE